MNKFSPKLGKEEGEKEVQEFGEKEGEEKEEKEEVFVASQT